MGSSENERKSFAVGRITMDRVHNFISSLPDANAIRNAFEGRSGSALRATILAEHANLETVLIWVSEERAFLRVSQFLHERLEGLSLSERQGAQLRFELPKQVDYTLPQIFGLIENNRADLGIESYSLSQTSLERIFNGFASQQEEETGEAAGLVRNEPLALPPSNAYPGELGEPVQIAIDLPAANFSTLRIEGARPPFTLRSFEGQAVGTQAIGIQDGDQLVGIGDWTFPPGTTEDDVRKAMVEQSGCPEAKRDIRLLITRHKPVDLGDLL